LSPIKKPNFQNESPHEDAGFETILNEIDKLNLNESFDDRDKRSEGEGGSLKLGEYYSRFKSKYSKGQSDQAVDQRECESVEERLRRLGRSWVEGQWQGQAMANGDSERAPPASSSRLESRPWRPVELKSNMPTEQKQVCDQTIQPLTVKSDMSNSSLTSKVLEFENQKESKKPKRPAVKEGKSGSRTRRNTSKQRESKPVEVKSQTNGKRGKAKLTQLKPSVGSKRRRNDFEGVHLGEGGDDHLGQNEGGDEGKGGAGLEEIVGMGNTVVEVAEEADRKQMALVEDTGQCVADRKEANRVMVNQSSREYKHTKTNLGQVESDKARNKTSNPVQKPSDSHQKDTAVSTAKVSYAPFNNKRSENRLSLSGIMKTQIDNFSEMKPRINPPMRRRRTGKETVYRNLFAFGGEFMDESNEKAKGEQPEQSKSKPRAKAEKSLIRPKQMGANLRKVVESKGILKEVVEEERDFWTERLVD
jgi:hypothetical protein